MVEAEDQVEVRERRWVRGMVMGMGTEEAMERVKETEKAKAKGTGKETIQAEGKKWDLD